MTDNARSEIVLATAALGALVSVGFLARKSLNKDGAQYPPGPPGYPFFGNLFDYPDPNKGETFDTMNLENALKYGQIFSVKIPFLIGRMIVVSDPELAHRVMVKKNYPKSMFYDQLTPLLGTRSLVSLPNGKEWASMRKTFHLGFQPDFLKNVVGVFAEKMERFVEAIDSDIVNKVDTNMLERSQGFTADVIVSVAFGEDWGTDKHPARVLEDEIARLYTMLAMNPLRRLYDRQTVRKMEETGVLLDEEMMKILHRRLAADDVDDKDTKDICSLAIKHMKKVNSSDSLTDEDKACIVDQMKTFYFAGHDTTATTISWAMWELSLNAEILDQVRKELKEHQIWTDPKTPPTYDQLQKCEYLDAVIRETLRLYPPASGLTRYNADKDETYKGYKIGGAILMVNAYCMHRHPDLWKKPEEFRPERMIDGSEGDASKKLMYFSKGPRDCIGKYFAMLEAKLAISALVSRYNLQCVDPNDRLAYNLTNVPAGGAKVRFTPRDQ